MSNERLRTRVLAEMEEIRGRDEATDLDSIRHHGGILLLHMDTDLLREIADRKDRLKAAFLKAPENEADPFEPTIFSPRHSQHPLHGEYLEYMELSGMLFSNDPYYVDEDDDEDNDLEPLGGEGEGWKG